MAQKFVVTVQTPEEELDVIKAQLKGISMTIACATVILPIGLPFWLSVPMIIGSPFFITWAIFKYKERN
ncbi:MAG: hypothetical protein WC426_01710 [Sulfuriferula sp.]